MKEDKNTYDQLVDASIISFGFMWGFMQKPINLESPLTSMICASMDGSLYAMCTTLLVSFLPRQYKLIVPVVLTVAIINKLNK